MYSVYEDCPAFEGENFSLRFVRQEDCRDLLKVYSDPSAQKLFNSDNCTDDFCYCCEEQMQMAIEFWLLSYRRGEFVRWSIVDRRNDEAVGTLELFVRSSEDEFDGVGILRLDLRSDIERAEHLKEILEIVVPETKAMFGCGYMAVKLPEAGQLRRNLFEEMGFQLSEHKLIGHDGTKYGSYYTKLL